MNPPKFGPSSYLQGPSADTVVTTNLDMCVALMLKVGHPGITSEQSISSAHHI